MPVTAYIPYSSSSLQAKPGQPTGTSKLCLSCHDGTIALGSVVSRNQPIAMAGGRSKSPAKAMIDRFIRTLLSRVIHGVVSNVLV